VFLIIKTHTHIYDKSWLGTNLMV